MKYLILPLALISTSVFASDTLSKSEKGEVELMLAEAASKLIYLERDCGKPMDKQKFKELAKIKAFSEGFTTIEGISWERVKRKAHKGYGALKIEAPVGELCEQYKADIKGNYRFLKEH
ncbi:hypothetical protein [Litorilituus lipolyticus]|uniref:DUF5329 domain-containing protein n=1 Tax=Litorilituus lipolyticus TaxID=2491017 RepID=A0A502KU32_9GAMM|nr:hypothetical protein [Litorilituus lipolyticus]TPH15240.1 hypothetical protein EPA86_10535 [Litorilituus lipolyticus]